MRPQGDRGDSAKGRVNESTRQRVNISTHGRYTGTKFGRRMQLPYAPIQVQKVFVLQCRSTTGGKPETTASSPQSQNLFCCHRHSWHARAA